MIDLFGMGKAPSSETPEHEEPRKPQAGSHGLWLFLLVLDSVFVAVFGGAVALKVYQYWRAPSVAAAPAGRRHPVAPKAPEQAAAPAPKPAAPPAPAPEPPKTVAAKPEPKIARHQDSPRPPKPSLINEPPKPRTTPGLASGAAPAAPAPQAAAGAPAKALPVVFKFRAANAGSVQLVGAFIVHGGRKDMAKASDGSWTVKLYLNPGQYRYFFSVDKKKTLDPENPNSDRGASLLTVP